MPLELRKSVWNITALDIKKVREIQSVKAGIKFKEVCHIKKKAVDNSLLAFRCAFCYQEAPQHIEGGIGMKYQGWSCAGFSFWFSSFFGLPDRGEVC
jgi:hypothetical protein